MTEKEIEKLEGRELDAAVAEHVMGQIWDQSRCRICGWPLKESPSEVCVSGNCSMRPSPERRADEPAHYSTDIAAAWLVVEKMIADRHTPFSIGRDHDPDNVFFVEFGPGDPWSAEAKSAPLAICRAALKAVAPVLA